VPFERLSPAHELIAHRGNYPFGHAPLALATPERDIIAIYLPVGGWVELDPQIDLGTFPRRQWFNPCTGELQPAEQLRKAGFLSPARTVRGHPQDWVLLLTRSE